MRFLSPALAISCVLASAAQAADRPNIIFMFTDDHAYQAISAYGSKVNQTPNIDRMSEHYYEGADSWHSVAKHEGIRTERYKLIHFYTLGYWEFYDLEEDPHEMNNLYGQASHEEQVSRLKGQLAELKSHYNVPVER